MKTKYKKQVDDFLTKTGSQLLLLRDEGVPHTVIMVRDNRSMDVLKIRAYTKKEQTTYDFLNEYRVTPQNWILDTCLTIKKLKN